MTNFVRPVIKLFFLVIELSVQYVSTRNRIIHPQYMSRTLSQLVHSDLFSKIIDLLGNLLVLAPGSFTFITYSVSERLNEFDGSDPEQQHLILNDWKKKITGKTCYFFGLISFNLKIERIHRLSLQCGGSGSF